jgi:hypothetical protein
MNALTMLYIADGLLIVGLAVVSFREMIHHKRIIYLRHMLDETQMHLEIQRISLSVILKGDDAKFNEVTAELSKKMKQSLFTTPESK